MTATVTSGPQRECEARKSAFYSFYSAWVQIINKRL